MKSIQAAVDTVVIMLLNRVAQGTGVLEGLSPAMRLFALGAMLFAVILTLNALWARVTRA